MYAHFFTFYTLEENDWLSYLLIVIQSSLVIWYYFCYLCVCKCASDWIHPFRKHFSNPLKGLAKHILLCKGFVFLHLQFHHTLNLIWNDFLFNSKSISIKKKFHSSNDRNNDWHSIFTLSTLSCSMSAIVFYLRKKNDEIELKKICYAWTWTKEPFSFLSNGRHKE